MKDYLDIKVSLSIFDDIKNDLNNLKDAYPYSKNNDCHNNAIDMCIRLLDEYAKQEQSKIIKKIKDGPY